MPYIIFALDNTGKEEIREQLRAAHRAHLRSAGAKLLASGALLDDEGIEVIGGISVLDTDSKMEAEMFAREDPYSTAGIRKETRILRWRKRWEDGVFLGERG